MMAEMVSIANTSTHISGYLAQPSGDGPFPGVVIVHEIFGLNDNIKEVAERFAAEGYVGLAVDLFAGRSRAVCIARFFAGMIFNSLNHGGIKDLNAALTYLADRPNVDADRLGAIGFCMGGTFAIAWACTDDRLKVAAPYYSMNPRPIEAVQRACPVVGSFPENDLTASGGRKLDEILDTYDIPHDIKVYPDAKHSFFNDKGGNYQEAAAQDAWARTLAFFKERIG